VANNIRTINEQMKETDETIKKFCDELWISSPF
jgi:hypothetical protein